MKHTLEADGIYLTFGTKRILSDIYIKCETGEITGILGRNGEGKTCLMNIVYGSLKVTDKSIRIDNTVIPQAFKRHDLITYLPQFNFIPDYLSLKRTFIDFNLDYEEFVEFFNEFHYKPNLSLNELSGGQRRLIEVYAIIKSESLFSMLDEPFSHIMPLHIEKINNILNIEKAKKGFLITDHMFRYVTEISNQLYILKDGKTHLINHISDIESLGYART
ncbi:ATP-binding cassette domain-containing protein [Pedobacter glucosidilyticus]|uniref:ATP-binding cassette domain-containing protein n=1 Tax=Pedobacter glucosidilyticus TaxID=1122941 RepID=UPI0026ED1FE6|nr:ATP-binding cassette domain-containing protein [Pedobacter glucosidilyticus]